MDLNTSSTMPPVAERSKIKSLMGRTPGIGILKSKFLTVLGNSNELLNGISNKLTLSISSSDSDYCDDDEEDLPKFDETIDYTKIDFEFRRVKARRAHEEIISGRFRYPNLAPKLHLEATRTKRSGKLKHSRSISSSSSSSSTSSSSSHSVAIDRSQVSSTTRSNSLESRHSGGYGRPGRAIAGARRSDLDIQKDLMKIHDVLNTSVGPPYIDVQEPSEPQLAIFSKHRSFSSHLNTDSLNMISTTSATSMRVPARSITSNSSTLTSLRDDPDVQVSPSIESTEWKNFIRSESQNSVPSWASSISLDYRAGEEPVKEFMKKFVDVLFINASAIGLELKSEFGAMTRLEIGRQWFTRFLLEQRSKSKRVSETAFQSLVQYFAIALFECSECEDYASAAIIMNLCFLFYYEIEVPGCDPYREYLFVHMRQQPIWQKLRFWNGAFFEAMHGERAHYLALKKKRAARRQRKKKLAFSNAETANVHSTDIVALSEEQIAGITFHEDSSSSSSHHSNALFISMKTEMIELDLNADNSDREHQNETRSQENIVFRQLGIFTCNMHALGIPQDICLEFLQKQTANASLNLSKEKIKLIKDNIHRMYQETDLWGAKEL